MAQEPAASATVAPSAPPPSPPPVVASAPKPTARVTWNEHWARARWWEYAGTGVAYVGLLSIQLFAPVPEPGAWRSGILFDNSVRSALALKTPEARDHANTLSDWFTLGPQAYVFADAAASVLYGADLDTAWQMTMMNFEALGSMGLLTRLGETYVRRQRPASVSCESDPSYSSFCRAGPAASFPSGHTSLAFTAAGLVCAHHTNLPLYGGGLADYATCAAALGVASTSATLRLMADRHWATDVLVGALLGGGIGYGFPMLLHYRSTVESPNVALRWAVAPFATGDAYGARMFGQF